MPRTPPADELDAVFAALANASRRRIITLLSNGVTSASALKQELGVSRQALNRQLQVLEAAHIVARRSEGRAYALEVLPETLDQVDTWTARIRAGWESNLDRLGEVLMADAEMGDER